MSSASKREDEVNGRLEQESENSFISHLDSTQLLLSLPFPYVLSTIISPILKMRNLRHERPCNLPKAVQQVSGGAGMWRVCCSVCPALHSCQNPPAEDSGPWLRDQLPRAGCYPVPSQSCINAAMVNCSVQA